MTKAEWNWQQSVCLLAAGRGGTGIPQGGWQLAIGSGKVGSAQLMPPRAHHCRAPGVLDGDLAVLNTQGAALVRNRQGHHQGAHKARVAAGRVSVLLEKAACRVVGDAWATASSESFGATWKGPWSGTRVAKKGWRGGTAH